MLESVSTVQTSVAQNSRHEGYIDQINFSMTHSSACADTICALQVWQGSQECSIKLIDSNNTYSQGHRVRISSFLVSGELATLQGSNSWLQEGIVQSASASQNQRLLTS